MTAGTQQWRRAEARLWFENRCGRGAKAPLYPIRLLASLPHALRMQLLQRVHLVDAALKRRSTRSVFLLRCPYPLRMQLLQRVHLGFAALEGGDSLAGGAGG